MCRSSRGAFEKWADEVDDQSYTFDNLLPFFKKSVHFNPPKSLTIPSNVSLPHQTEDFSLTGGPLQVSFARHLNTISSWLGNAFEELGFARLPSFSDGRLFGWSYFTYTGRPLQPDKILLGNVLLTRSTKRNYQSELLQVDPGEEDHLGGLSKSERRTC